MRIPLQHVHMCIKHMYIHTHEVKRYAYVHTYVRTHTRYPIINSYTHTCKAVYRQLDNHMLRKDSERALSAIVIRMWGIHVRTRSSVPEILLYLGPLVFRGHHPASDMLSFCVLADILLQPLLA